MVSAEEGDDVQVQDMDLDGDLEGDLVMDLERESEGNLEGVLDDDLGQAAASTGDTGLCRAWNKGGCDRKMKWKFAHRCGVLSCQGEACRGRHRATKHI